MDGLCMLVLNTIYLENINSSQIIMDYIYIYSHSKMHVGIGHHPTSKNCYRIGREKLPTKTSTCEWRCNGLELFSRLISCSHAFLCFPWPILGIFHIVKCFYSQILYYGCRCIQLPVVNVNYTTYVTTNWSHWSTAVGYIEYRIARNFRGA